MRELPWTKSAFLSELYSRVKHLYLGILHNERMIGFIGVRILGADAHITNIAIIPDYQGKGIGSFLLEKSNVMHGKQMRPFDIRSSPGQS